MAGDDKSIDSRSRRAVVCAAMLALLFFAGSLLAPVLTTRGASAGSLLHLAYAPLCHQLPERSLAVGEGFQAVCARCSGLYAGGVVGLIVGGVLALSARRRPRPLWLVLLGAPTLIDALLPWIGLPALANGPRWLVALPAGLMAGLFLAVGVADLFATAEPAGRNPDRPTTNVLTLEEADG